MSHTRRTAFSLLELLVAVTIIGVLIGLLLPAIQRVRSSAIRTKNFNQLRQIGIGLHNFAGEHDGSMPGFGSGPFDFDSSVDSIPLNAIEPYIELQGQARSVEAGINIPGYMDPADPTANLIAPSRNVLMPISRGSTSYAFNMVAFSGRPKLGIAFADGSSTTIAFAEHYARGGPEGFFNYSYSLRSSNVSGYPASEYYIQLSSRRRGSFADAYYGDVLPVTVDGVTQPSRAGATFQVQPTPEQFDPFLPQSPYAGGMPVLMFDGSVRMIQSSISPSAFWSAVTREGGEITTLD